MHIYSIEQLMSAKDKYTDPPYPGFSLEEVVRRKKQKGHAVLKRGENAWCSKMPIDKEEGFSRRLQGSLNKLAPEKYNEIITELRQPQMLEEGPMQVFIRIIFQKALLEPGYSEMYARLCIDMARYELTLNQTPSDDPSRRKSRFRDAIVRRTQAEFQETPEETKLASLTGDEYDEALSHICRRKKANIKFVGQLFIHKVLSSTAIFGAINSILRTSTTSPSGAYVPHEIDIEVLCELLETVGKQLDSEDRAKMDMHMQRLELLRDSPKYPHRIRFKILDTLELRLSQWVPRVARAGYQAPTTLKEQQRLQAMSAAKSPTVTPTRKGGNMRFPDSPSPHTPPSGGGAWRNVTAPARGLTPSIITPSANNGRVFPREAPDGSTLKVPLPKKVREVASSWLAEGAGEAILDWQAKFSMCGVSEDALQELVVAEVMRDACTSSKREAQIEACSFLKVGLGLTDAELYQGFANTLAKAIDDDILEDAPKFNDRFVHSIALICENDANDAAVAAAEILFLTLDQINALEGIDANDVLLAVWRKLPPTPPLHPGVLKPILDVRGSGASRMQLTAELLDSLVERGLLERKPIAEWAASPDGAAADDLLQLLRERRLLD